MTLRRKYNGGYNCDVAQGIAKLQDAFKTRL